MRDKRRHQDAKAGGYAPPPRESDCPERTAWCWCCLRDMDPVKLQMDHDHVTGAFRAWVCAPCNNGAGIMDDVEGLQARVDLLTGKNPLA
jgi:hypothetical protein